MAALHEDGVLAGPAGPLKRWCLGLGGVLAVLGVLAIASPWTAATIVETLCAAALILAGVTQVAMAAGTYTWRGFWLALLCGALSIMAGTVMFALPKIGTEAIAVFLGIVILFEAAAKLTAAFSVPRDYPWGWLLVDGVVTAVVGGMLVTCTLDQSGVYLGVLVGLNLLSSGIGFLAAGIWLRSAAG
jgi:uncharacterized membrane protein HdeD (DUF308 family)